MENYRLNRLFNPVSKKCFDVAIDHGFFNEYKFLSGIENIRAVITTIVNAAPDAIQLTAGQARYLQRIPGKNKPALVLRTDVANVYGESLTSGSFSKIIEQAALQAVRLDAACMCVNLFSIPGAPEVTGHCIENIVRLKLEAAQYQMPLMIEPLVFRPNSEAGGYTVDGDITKIIPLVRQAAELGADIIKADPCSDVGMYHRVIEVAGDIPVLVRGGGKTTDRDIITRTFQLMQQGAAGIVYGRNIIQHPDPALITRILMGVVHENKTAAESIAGLEIAGKREGPLK